MRVADRSRKEVSDAWKVLKAYPSVQAVRSRSVRGYIVFAFAVGLVLLIAYLMREILLLLYVSALFAVVLTPLIRGIMRISIMTLASQAAGWRSFSCC